MGEQQGILKENKRKNLRKKGKKKNFFLNLTKNIHIYLGISLELLQSVQVQFNFRQLLFPAYTSRYLQDPSGVVGVTFRDFNLLHRSFLKRFLLFVWILFAVSSVSNFHPDTGGWRCSLIQVRQFSSVLLRGGRGAADRYLRSVWGALTVFRPHWVCPAQGCLCFLYLHCSGSRLLYMEQALR